MCISDLRGQILCAGLKGGALVSTLYHYSQNGDPAVRSLVKHLLTQVSGWTDGEKEGRKEERMGGWDTEGLGGGGVGQDRAGWVGGDI